MNERHHERARCIARTIALEVSRGPDGQKLKEAASDPSSRYLLGMPDWEYLLARTIERAIGEHGSRVRNEHLYEYATTTVSTGRAFEPPAGGGWEYLTTVPFSLYKPAASESLAIVWQRPLILPESR